ncbi:hypothetical protein pb186bvf_020121 [Paramecium bursaria]
MNISLALFSNIISDQVKQVQQQKSKQLNWRQEKEKLIKVFNDNKQRSSTQERPQERKSRNLMEFLYNRQSGEKTTRESKRNLSPSPNKISLSTIITKYQKQVEHQKESIQPLSTNDFADKIIESFNQLKNQQRQKFNQKCYSEQKEDSGHKDHIMTRINSIKEMLDQVIPNKDIKSQSTEKQTQVKTGGTDKKLSIQNFNIYQNEQKPSAPPSQVSSNIWKDRIQCIESQYQSEDESYASRNKSVEIRQWIDQHLNSQSNHQSIITQKFNKLRTIKSCTTLDVGIQVELTNPQCIKINLPKLELSGIKFSSQKYDDADDIKSQLNPDSNLFSQKQELLQIQIPDPSEDLQITQPQSQTTRSIQIPQLIQQPIIYQQEFQANLAEAFSNRLTERLEKLQESDQIEENQESENRSMEKSQSQQSIDVADPDKEITEKEIIEKESTNRKDETDPNEPILFKQFLQTQQLQLQDLNLRQFTDVQLQYSEDTANQRFQTNNSVQEEKVDQNQSQDAQAYQICEVKHESLNQSSFEQWLLSKSNVDARQIINLNCQSQYLKKEKQQSNQVDHSTQINKQDIDDSDSDEEIAEIKQKHKANLHVQGATLLVRKILQLNKMILIKSFYVIKDVKKKKSTAIETINTILNTIAEETGYDTLRTLQRNNSALQDNFDSLNKPHLERIRNSSYFQKLSSSKKKGFTSPVQQINDRIKVNFVQEMGLESPVQKSTEQVEFNDFSPIADPMEYQEVSIFKEPKKSNKSSTHKKPNNSESQILTNHIAIQKARIGKKFQQIHYRTVGQKQSKENIFAK